MTGLEDSADLASSLRIAIGRLSRRLRSERSADLPTLTQLSALAALEHCGPQSPTALAALERVQPPSMTRVISRLEELGLVARVPHPSDGRQVVIAISARGLELIEEDRRRKDAWLSSALDSLDAVQRAQLSDALAVLEKLVET